MRRRSAVPLALFQCTTFLRQRISIVRWLWRTFVKIGGQSFACCRFCLNPDSKLYVQDAYWLTLISHLNRATTAARGIQPLLLALLSLLPPVSPHLTSVPYVFAPLPYRWVVPLCRDQALSTSSDALLQYFVQFTVLRAGHAKQCAKCICCAHGNHASVDRKGIG